MTYVPESAWEAAAEIPGVGGNPDLLEGVAEAIATARDEATVVVRVYVLQMRLQPDGSYLSDPMPENGSATFIFCHGDGRVFATMPQNPPRSMAAGDRATLPAGFLTLAA